MERVGYARVSSFGQSLDVQLDKLKGCDKIFQEKKSGLDGEREQLNRCLDYVRDGDILVITRLDRLARSTSHLFKISEFLDYKKVTLHVIDQNIETATPTGKLLFTMLSAIAQFETEIRKERQMEGIRKAQSDGVHIGRKKKLQPEDIKALQEKRAAGVLIKDLAKEYGMEPMSVYRYLKVALQ
jgi:DNA invertase Pin-like site-specific DNA recombinase